MSQNIHKLSVPRRANEAVDSPLEPGEAATMIAAATQKIGELLDVLRNDHNTRDTPARVARMYVEELLRGRFSKPPEITEFDNPECYDQLIVTGPIDVRSICAHLYAPERNSLTEATGCPVAPE
jgi:GTP cyclohydrolase I